MGEAASQLLSEHRPVHGPLTAVREAAAKCQTGLDAAGFNRKEKSRGGGNISGKMPRRAEHVGKPRTALLFSRWECGKWEGCSSQTRPPLQAAVNTCVTVVYGSQHPSPARLFAPWGQGSYLLPGSVICLALALRGLSISVWWMRCAIWTSF